MTILKTIYYSLGKTNSCRLLIAIYCHLNICVKNKVNENDGTVLILKAIIDGCDYLLINLYNANTKRELSFYVQSSYVYV